MDQSMNVQVSGKRSRGGLLTAAAGILFVAPALLADVASIGLINRYVDVVLQNISMGRKYEIGHVQSQKFAVTNQGLATLSVNVEKEIPDPSFLKPGYEPIPDTAWLTISPSHFELKPGKTMEGKVTLRIPKDSRWKGRHFQASLWTHSDGQMAVGVRSLVRFSIETDAVPAVMIPEKSLNVRLISVSGKRLHASAGKKETIGTVHVRNDNKSAVKINLRSIRPQGNLPQGITAMPNPNFLQLSQETIEIPAESMVDVKLLANIPAGKAHFGRIYAFSLRADGIGNTAQAVFANLYLEIK